MRREDARKLAGRAPATAPASLVAGAWIRPMILPRSSSSDGRVASALTAAASSALPASPPPTIVNLSLRLANATAAFAAATGSCEKAIAVGPVNSGASSANGVPSSARLRQPVLGHLELRARRSRIWRRSVVASATDSPV